MTDNEWLVEEEVNYALYYLSYVILGIGAFFYTFLAYKIYHSVAIVKMIFFTMFPLLCQMYLLMLIPTSFVLGCACFITPVYERYFYRGSE